MSHIKSAGCVQEPPEHYTVSAVNLSRVQEDRQKPAGESRRVVTSALRPQTETQVWGLKVSGHAALCQGQEDPQEDPQPPEGDA